MDSSSNKWVIIYSSEAYHESLLELFPDRSFSLIALAGKHFPDPMLLADTLKVYLLDHYYLENNGEDFLKFYRDSDDTFHQIILISDPTVATQLSFPFKLISGTFQFPITDGNIFLFHHMIKQTFQNIEAMKETLELRKTLLNRTSQLHELTSIGIALNTERDIDKLLALILEKAKDVTFADSGSLYLVEKDPQAKDKKKLRFKLSSINLESKEFTLEINHKSIAGYVALTGTIVNLEDAYFPPMEAKFSINKSFDEETGYRTKSMVVVPMKNQKEIVIGVLQLINCKPNKHLKLKDKKHIEEVVIPFDDNKIEVITAFAGQAAVAIENNNLYKAIHNLFEGFVTAAVTAIESRDPTTSGHSSRVAKLTVGLADTVNRVENGPYGKTFFSPDQIREIRYASLLHDFGKVGVREKVLVKAKKLYPYDLTRIFERFQFIKRTIQKEISDKKVRYLLEQNRQATLEELNIFDQEELHRIRELDEYIEFILKANEPSVMESGSFEKILEIAKLQYQDLNHDFHNFLDQDEINYLFIRKGSLNEEERYEIESHVTHTFKFLSQIPWTNELKDIPLIAYAHHEKLTGDGYPNKLTAAEIPVQSRIMTVSDIFDALTARDRPYKRAVPLEKALDILEFEVKGKKIDKDLFYLFKEARIFDLVAG
jgi:HD-GYP domain-containing protein (c-di-GMP phosphodiesterase class II)